MHDHQDAMESYFAVGAQDAELETVVDPAENDDLLKSTLEIQRKESKAKMDQLMDEYSRKQIETNEVAEAVPDDEPVGNESEEEPEEDEPDEEKDGLDLNVEQEQEEDGDSSSSSSESED